MQTHTHHALPTVNLPPGGMDLAELMDVTARLADILEEETGYLKAMEIGALAALQEKKLELTQTLESYQRLIAMKPDLLKREDAQMLEQFAALTEDLTAVVEENFRRTAVARAVNQRVVKTIVEVMSENERPATYGRSGNSSLNQDLSLSFNLDQKA